MFVLWAVVRARWGLARPYPPPFRWRRHVRWGILWNFEGFLVAHQDAGDTYIRGVQVRGYNRSRRFIQLRSARIVSAVTAKSVPALVQTPNGYVLPADRTIRVPPRAEFWVHALFDHTRPGSSRKGLRRDEFLRDYSTFYFVVGYDDALFRKELTPARIHAELERLPS